jgi:hypothetical protein
MACFNLMRVLVRRNGPAVHGDQNDDIDVDIPITTTGGHMESIAWDLTQLEGMELLYLEETSNVHDRLRHLGIRMELLRQNVRVVDLEGIC